MEPRHYQKKKRHTSKVMLGVSFVFHSAIVVALAYFAAKEGLLGKQIQKIAVEMVKEKPPEKPKEPEKPKVEPPKVETPKMAEAPKVDAPKTVAAVPPPSTVNVAPPAVAPPAMDIPAFVFDGGKAVQTSSDPVALYKGQLETALRSKWNRPTDIMDDTFVAEVEIMVDRRGQIGSPIWKKGSGNTRWDDSVRSALAVAKGVERPPPTNFPPSVLVRFDVEVLTETVSTR